MAGGEPKAGSTMPARRERLSSDLALALVSLRPRTTPHGSCWPKWPVAYALRAPQTSVSATLLRQTEWRYPGLAPANSCTITTPGYAQRTCDRLPEGATSAERRSERNKIFMREPVDGGGCRVFACRACKRLCRAGSTTDKKPRYVQCSPADLDLFDGVDEENEFHTIGIGDRQPKAYENLSCNDRMLLGVLKV